MRRVTKRWIRVGAGAAILACLGALGFVVYILCVPYEAEHELHPSEVPGEVLREFDRMFPGASNVEWEREDDKVEAEFDGEHGEMEVYFTPDGTWMMTEYDGDADDLPAKAVEYLDSYDGYEYEDHVAHVSMRDSPAAFKVELESKLMEWECFFDAEGNLLARERDGPILEED